MWKSMSLVAVIVLASSCDKMPWSTKLTGTVAAGKSYGSFRLSVTQCRNGRQDGFFGVWLRDKQKPDKLLRIAKDPTTGTLVVAVSNRGQLKIASGCRFSNQKLVDHSGTAEVIVLAGTIEFTCKDISGSVRFQNCYDSWE